MSFHASQGGANVGCIQRSASSNFDCKRQCIGSFIPNAAIAQLWYWNLTAFGRFHFCNFCVSWSKWEHIPETKRSIVMPDLWLTCRFIIECCVKVSFSVPWNWNKQELCNTAKISSDLHYLTFGSAALSTFWLFSTKAK